MIQQHVGSFVDSVLVDSEAMEIYNDVYRNAFNAAIKVAALELDRLSKAEPQMTLEEAAKHLKISFGRR